jgi:hypothetical protein
MDGVAGAFNGHHGGFGGPDHALYGQVLVACHHEPGARERLVGLLSGQGHQATHILYKQEGPGTPVPFTERAAT